MKCNSLECRLIHSLIAIWKPLLSPRRWLLHTQFWNANQQYSVRQGHCYLLQIMPPVTEPKDAFDQDQASGSQLAISGSQMRIMYHVFQLHESERCLDLSIISKGVGHLCFFASKKGFSCCLCCSSITPFLRSFNYPTFVRVKEAANLSITSIT